MDKNCPLYNKTICSQLSGDSFEDYFITGHKYRYELMCDVDSYDIIHPAGPVNGISYSGRPLTNTSSTYALETLNQTINFFDNWLQFFSIM